MDRPCATALTLVAAVLLSGPEAHAAEAATAPLVSRPSPAIQGIVSEISAERIEATIRKLVSFGTRHTLSDPGSDTRGIGAARRWIRSEMERHSKESGGRLRVELDEFTADPGPRIPAPTRIVNVVATLPGVSEISRETVYVVSGHYDSICSDPLDATCDAPGADDDASGTAVVLELARVLSRHTFEATIVFLAVAGEEQGLVGSTHWAKSAAEKKLRIAGMFTNDIVGASRGEDGRATTHVRLFAEGVPAGKEMPPELSTLVATGGENDSPSRQLARAVRELAEANVPLFPVKVIYRRDRYLRGGDHAPFLNAGFPALRFTEPVEDYRHQHQTVREESGVQYGDLPEFLDFAFAANVARVNAAALAGLASAPASPEGVEIETVVLENDTTLHWSANREGDLAGYRIVWRETTSPFWEHAMDVGNVTRATVRGVSKDNVVFGVQAVDRDGNRSPAVFPRPFRPPPKKP